MITSYPGPSQHRQWLKEFFRILSLGLPVLTIVIGLFFEAMPMPSVPANYSAPRCAFAILFFWAMFQPKTIPIVILIPLSLFADLLLYKPLPLTLITWLPLYSIVRNERATMGLQRSFLVVWAWFALFLLLSIIISYLGHSIVYGLSVPHYGLLISFFLTLLLFPLLYSFLQLLDHRLFPR